MSQVAKHQRLIHQGTASSMFWFDIRCKVNTVQILRIHVWYFCDRQCSVIRAFWLSNVARCFFCMHHAGAESLSAIWRDSPESLTCSPKSMVLVTCVCACVCFCVVCVSACVFVYGVGRVECGPKIFRILHCVKFSLCKHPMERTGWFFCEYISSTKHFRNISAVAFRKESWDDFRNINGCSTTDCELYHCICDFNIENDLNFEYDSQT